MIIVSVLPAPVVSALPTDEQIRIFNVSVALQVQLVEKLKRTGMKIEALPADTLPIHAPGTFLLRCFILRADAGNRVLRLAVGFGAGKGMLRTHTELIDLGDDASLKLASWNTDSSTGALPGPVVGFFGPVIAGPALGIVGGSAGVLPGIWQTQAREVDQTSTEIVDQLHTLIHQQN
ncbi:MULTISPECIES: DUF4410 domain-containing protein [unclassified Paraburkholderia]|uniref:DUF4410 domain-containing protein n=1 Tax=unclassified Paraburkholderia TaxID=2615204 RepID=UPI002AB18D94|nr:MULTISPECIES: DUF4410 domain-containing protein [unclassified Paraburkholderia]